VSNRRIKPGDVLTLPVLAALTDLDHDEIEQLITEGQLPAPNHDKPRGWRGPVQLMALADAFVAMPSIAARYGSAVLERLARAASGLTGGPSPSARAASAVIERLALVEAANPVNRALTEPDPLIRRLLNRPASDR
jgi:hypothetical protein